MSLFSGYGSNESGTTNKTLINLIAATTVRPKLYDLILGCDATPADQAMNFVVGQTTAIGTAAATPTPQPLDPNDAASLCTLGTGHSAEPTYGATYLLNISMNQRATFRWVAVPGCELVAVRAANSGLGLRLASASTALIADATIMWSE